MMSNRKY